MANERQYYCLCMDNCRFPTMTKEQIIAAIAEATGNTPTSVDDAFITKIQDQNANKNISLWVGTTAQYNAIVAAGELVQDCLYITTGDNAITEILAAIAQIQEVDSKQTQDIARVADDCGGVLLGTNPDTETTDNVTISSDFDILSYDYFTIEIDGDTANIIVNFNGIWRNSMYEAVSASGLYKLEDNDAVVADLSITKKSDGDYEAHAGYYDATAEAQRTITFKRIYGHRYPKKGV